MTTLTAHARHRASQRSINEYHIDYALRCGHRVHTTDQTLIVVGERPMLPNQDPPSEQSKWVVLVVNNDCDAVVTCYRNKSKVRRFLSTLA